LKKLLLNQKILLAGWTVIGGIILWFDYVSGPNIAFSYFFLIPVVLAARYNGAFYGLSFAVVLPLIRFCFHFVWDDQMSLQDDAFNLAIRVVILVGAALIVDRVTRQAHEIQVLRGFLPICSVCKKIRDSDQHWSRIETYITKHSEAKFSHTLCPDCGRKHYGEWINEEGSSQQKGISAEGTLP
jgi:hypothetical protein